MPRNSLTHQYRHTPGAPPPFKKPSKGSLRSIIILISVFGTIWIFCRGPVEAMKNVPSSTSTNSSSPTITQFLKSTITNTPLPTRTKIPSTPTGGITPTITLQVASNFPCVGLSSEREEAKLVRVTDGDTIVVSMNAVEYKVRYIGVDSPEQGAKYFQQASDYNKKLLNAGNLVMIKDASETDKYDRLLRYVFAGGKFVNYEMVKSGFAKSGSWPPDTSCDDSFASAMTSAQTNHLGIWYVAPLILATAPARVATYPAPTNPPVVVLPTSAPPSSGGGCDPSYPGVCIPPPPPDLDCSDIPYRRFQVLSPDPHGFDRDGDGIGCEG